MVRYSIDSDFLSNKHGRIKYNPALKIVSKKMAHCLTYCENLVWENILKSKKTGFKFVKQKIIFNYVIDFYCTKLRLAIEIDGEEHNSNRDKFRDEFLSKMGIRVLRIKNEEVLVSIDKVKERIIAFTTPISPK